MITNYDRNDIRLFNVDKKEFSDNLCPAELKMYSPLEVFDKLYFIQLDATTLEQKISYFSNDEITVASFKKITPYDLVTQAGIFGFQQLTEFTDINDLQVIGALSKYPALLLKFADNIEPFIEGEYNTQGKSIRDILQELSNNYLAWNRVDYNKKGFYVKRGSAATGDVLSFKKQYTAQRITEVIYSERYDGVEIENGNGLKYSWGDTDIDAKVLSLKLEFIPDDFVPDMAKYFYDYYSVERKLKKISYLPTFYNFDSLDKADLTNYGLGQGIIHTVRPNGTRAEFEVLIDD
ncbi:unnamed protein product [Rotaria sp. Silwood1]|nr:unnamed protein product [Rotaria sp. Silwood1]CAF4836171.1 unnamed protein product [Rotaria sp. Silwood1]